MGRLSFRGFVFLRSLGIYLVLQLQRSARSRRFLDGPLGAGMAAASGDAGAGCLPAPASRAGWPHGVAADASAQYCPVPGVGAFACGRDFLEWGGVESFRGRFFLCSLPVAAGCRD